MLSLEIVLENLRDLSDNPDVDPDTPLVDLDVDSLDLLEWAYTLEDDHGVAIQEEELSAIAADGALTVRDVYERFMAASPT